MSEKILYSKDLTVWLKVSRQTVSRWVNRRHNPLPCMKPSGDNGPSRFLESKVLEWLESSRVIRDGGESSTPRKYTSPPQPKPTVKTRDGRNVRSTGVVNSGRVALQ